MKKMNNRFARPLVWGACLVMGLSILSSCGSSGGGDDEKEFVFNSNQMVDKMWFRDVWLNRPDDFVKEDGVEVLQFDVEGALRRIEYGGARDSVVGSWSLSKDELIVKEGDNLPETFYVGRESTGQNLYLTNENGLELNYRVSIPELDGVTADACLVKDYNPANGVPQYHFEFTLKGEGINGASVLLDGESPIELSSVGEAVFGFVSPVSVKYWEEHKVKVKFVVSFATGWQTKLTEYIYTKEVPDLNVAKILPVHGSMSSDIVVNWESIEDENVFYQVHLLDENKDEDHPVFVSYVLKEGSGSLEINSTTGGVVNKKDGLIGGKAYSVKLVAFRYEPGIDKSSKNRSYNIQAKTQFVKEMGAW